MTLERKIIVPSGQQANYPEARKIVSGMGLRLASHVLHDEYLARGERWKEVEAVYPAWAREMIVHPQRGGEFTEGIDVVDSETGWRLPASYLSDPRFVDSDVFRKGIGLFIDPEDVIEERGRMVVIPASIVALYPFIQESKTCGKVDYISGVPLAIEPQRDMDRRWLYRIEGVGVRPLARGRGNYFIYDRRFVVGFCKPAISIGVAGETEGTDAPREPGPGLRGTGRPGSNGSGQLSLTKQGAELIVRGSTDQIDAALRVFQEMVGENP